MTQSIGSNRGQPFKPGARGLGVAAIDPVPLYREGLAALIHRTPGLYWLGHAGAHHSALQMCEQLRPDTVLVDSGLDPQGHLIRLLAAGEPGTIVVVVVRDANRTPHFLATVLAAGAHAAVPRATEPRKLTEAILRAHADRRYVDPALATLTSRPKRQPAGQPPGQQQVHTQMPLSRREYQVLQLVAEGLENSAIAKVLYLSVETVRTHVKSILRKLSARDRTHAVTTAFRRGILVVRPDDSLGSSPKEHYSSQSG
ncbi:LuxR C-terminal-related transcriptional regulator [Amycolatopsis cihanbeyliensis]|uniref:LuxR family two component transcriptional regulator n=1 Tax=Amycolatopsis cihanbeyliensis TaxID=1128664 RepID=A0A542DKW1_AMYCI|nr:response regulator transcription factor [Amycolatopsis cihanbeyliensis]TQJ03703.1 LuxR family two component transcriptional regulator [Amycolatopsis cihanbeyliensis]